MSILIVAGGLLLAGLLAILFIVLLVRAIANRNGGSVVVVLGGAVLLPLGLLVLLGLGLVAYRVDVENETATVQEVATVDIGDSESYPIFRQRGPIARYEPIGGDQSTSVEVLPGQFRISSSHGDGQSSRESTVVILRSDAGFPIIEIQTDRDGEWRESVVVGGSESGHGQDSVLVAAPADSESTGMVAASSPSATEHADTQGSASDSGTVGSAHTELANASGTQLPSWVALKTGNGNGNSPLVTVSGRPKLNREDAEADAWQQVVDVLEQEFQRQNPDASGWRLPDQVVVRDEVIVDEFDQIYLAQMTDGLTEPTHIMHYRVNVSPEAMQQIRPYWQNEVVTERMMTLGFFFGGITLCLGVMSFVLRMDTTVSRCTAKKVAFAVAMALAIGAVVAIRFFRQG